MNLIVILPRLQRTIIVIQRNIYCIRLILHVLKESNHFNITNQAIFTNNYIYKYTHAIRLVPQSD